MKSDNKTQQEIASSAKAAAHLTGLPLPWIKAARHLGCPAFTARGAVKLDELRQWVGQHEVEVKNHPEVQIAEEAAKIVQIDRQSKELDLGIKRGQFVPLDKMILFMSQLGHDWRTIVLEMHLMAPAMVGQPQEVCEKLLVEFEQRQLDLLKRLDDLAAQHGEAQQ